MRCVLSDSQTTAAAAASFPRLQPGSAGREDGGASVVQKLHTLAEAVGD